LTDRRPVRATYGFFEDLDRQLGSERGPNGEPSTADFQTIELLRVVDRFAVQFDDLPELIPGRSDYRVLLTSGVLVRALSLPRPPSPPASASGRYATWCKPSWLRPNYWFRSQLAKVLAASVRYRLGCSRSHNDSVTEVA
jgi:hypothetical protein